MEKNAPLLADEDMQVGSLFIKKGCVKGVLQSVHGYKDGKEVITESVEGWVCTDSPPFWVEIKIKGEPDVNMRYEMIREDGWVTPAVVVNVIPRVISAPAGLIAMKDLQMPSAVMGDMRNFVV